MTGAGPAPPTRETVTGDRRVTVDLDDCTRFDLIQSWRRLAECGVYDLRARVSSGGEGAHLRGFIDAEDADEQDVETIRYFAGDHGRRVEMDRTHAHKPPQVLFDSKPGGEAGAWHDNPIDAADALAARSDRYGLESWN